MNILYFYGLQIFCFLLLTIAAWCDYKTRKIPNYLVMPILLFCFAKALVDAVNFNFINLLFLGVCFFAGMLPGLGLGDIKLIMCVGVLTEPFWALMDTALASILVLVVYSIRNPMGALLRLQTFFRHPFPVKNGTVKLDNNSVPFAVYLLGAYILIEGGKFLCAF